jgi:UDP-N-acetylglucosamine 2-epimerase (non-hydrolysing)
MGLFKSPALHDDPRSEALKCPPGFGRDVVRKALTLFGTRPEAIKLAPVIRELEARPGFETCNVTSAQHTDLLYPFTRFFGIRLDHDLGVMREGQTIAGVCSRVLAALDALLEAERPDVLLVQGDTTTALAGSLAGFFRGVPVGHVEAGLRSGDPRSPFPEEMNRRLTTRMASLHFAATERNVRVLRAEGVPASSIFLTGNPVVDSLRAVLDSPPPADGPAAELLERIAGTKPIVLTTHRRESFGDVMSGNLRVLREFVEARPEASLVFPVHPNPNVREPTLRVLGGAERVHLVDPLGYFDFVRVLSAAWLVVSDSGGVQEEAPTLGRPLLVLRENTERPEAIEAGVARLVGGRPETLRSMLEELWPDHPWIREVRGVENPFGRGDAAIRIADSLERWLAGAASAAPASGQRPGVRRRPPSREAIP